MKVAVDCAPLLHLVMFLFIDTSISKSVPKEKCTLCKDIVKNINEGLKRTARAGFGGGNTHWEENSLGSYTNSETRFVEITGEDEICRNASPEKGCHMLFEEHEEILENWWFNVRPKNPESDLFTWFCIESVKVCCYNNTYGADCDACTGGTERPCKGNGRCDGEGTREGKGNCFCEIGYKGEMCDECTDNYYEEYKNETHTQCTTCHESCKSTCWEGGPKGCDECKDGWNQSEEEGCVDINECEAEDYPCDSEKFCTNTYGSYRCTECDVACETCLGDGADKCTKCAEGYIMINNSCTDVDECAEDVCKGDHQSCVNSVGSYQCTCDDGFTMDEEDNECIPEPPAAEDAKTSTEVENNVEDSKEKQDTLENITEDSKSKGERHDKISGKQKSKKNKKQSSKTEMANKKIDLRIEMVKYYASLVIFVVAGKVTQGNIRIITVLCWMYAGFVYRHCSQFDNLSNLKI